MQRFFLLLIATTGLVSCSSSSSEPAPDPRTAGGSEIKISEDGSNNPFAFRQEDVQQGDDGSIVGGKRSQYESRVESAYAKANSSLPDYLQRSYQKSAWSGSKNYGTGSYQTAESKDSGKRSWFGGRKSGESDQVARASGQNYSTGSYQTGGASEAGRSVKTGSSGYIDSQNSKGWGRKKPIILSEGEYHRSLSLGQAKSLLGR